VPTNKNDAANIIQRLARELAVQIELNYLPAEMAQCTGSLVPMYQARPFGPLSESAEHVIGLIERAIADQPHYACIDCHAVFADTQDLGIVTESHIQLLDPTQNHPAGICPVCGSEVRPRAA
jgi:hypothetical protein